MTAPGNGEAACVVFFDLDETLFNQRQAELRAATNFFSQFRDMLPCNSPAELCQLWRMLRERHLPDYLAGWISYDEHHRRRVRDLCCDGERISDAEADDRYRAFLGSYRQAWRLFDDVAPMLRALGGVRMGIISNGNGRQQRHKLEAAGILARFTTIVVSDEVRAAKPDRRIFETACARARVPACDCVYVGDRLHADARASCAAGMRGIWLDRQRTGLKGGVETIHALDELAPLLQPVWERPGGYALRRDRRA